MVKRKINYILLGILLILSCLLTCFTSIINVYADSVSVVGGYTNVLEDLKLDSSFNEDDYPLIEDNYSLEVINLAESSDKEVFVYVYQPSANYKNFIASSIFVSTSPAGLDYKNYYLSLINKQGVFYKYRINNLFVSDSTTRHYEVTSIYRPFDENIDEKLDDDNENIINEVNFKVAKHWTFTTNENGVGIVCQDIETIRITDKYVGFVRYEQGYSGILWGTHVEPGYDSHFVAFNTDKQIDKLMEADVYFTKQSFMSAKYKLESDDKTDYTFGDIVEDYAYLSYKDKVLVEIPGGRTGNRFVWDRITTPTEFEQNVSYERIFNCGIFNVTTESKLTQEGMQDIKDKKWILRFAETEYKEYRTSASNNVDALFQKDIVEKTIVGSVSILRLKFETDGIVYNLGVIDNKQQGDGNPDNYTKRTFAWNEEFKILLAILGLILLCIVFAPVLPVILNVVIAVLKIVIKILLWIVLLPFRCIGWIIKKSKRE